MIRFILNHQVIHIDHIDPSTSLLDYVRSHKRLTGSKEGCASGDCGACTVAVGELQQHDKQSVSDAPQSHHSTHYHPISYRSVNACLMLLASCHGKHIVTVEYLTQQTQQQRLDKQPSQDVMPSLQSEKGLWVKDNAPTLERLHPVQRALVNCHGSQCGFCTPGIVMSLYALYLSFTEYPGQSTVIEYLGGNLCRCTGYRPILEAAKQAFAEPRVELVNEAFIAEQLHRLLPHSQDAMPSLQSEKGLCVVPQSLAALLATKHQQPTARLVAGATDLALELTQELAFIPHLVYVGQVAELLRYQSTDTHITIGSALPYSEFLPDLLEEYPEAQEVFHRLGSLQIRNTGTLGGSLANASPIGDPAPLLIALRAQVVLANQQQQRTMLVEDFFTTYRTTQLQADEIILSINIPKRKPQQRLFFYKVSKRIEDDISAVCVAMSCEIKDNTVLSVKTGWGGVAATPVSAVHFEKALIGQTWSLSILQSVSQQLEQDFQPLSDVRASATYRMMLAKQLVERCYYQFQNIPVRVQHAAL